MENAIKAIKGGQMGYLKASKYFNIPKATLIRRCKEQNKRVLPNEKGLGFYKPVFTKLQEEELENYVLDMEIRFFGITLLDLRSLAFQLAEKNQIQHPFNKTKRLAGLDWTYGFRKRHPKISLRKPESTSAARAQAFNRYNVKQFFDLYKSILDSKKIKPTRTYNCDETGLGTVPKCNSKILAKRGRKQVGRLTSADRSGTTTAIICMSSSGTFVPPLLIFARKRMKVELQDGAPPGTIFACSESGWINAEIFLLWFKHFVQEVKPTEDDPVLLVLDGHSSHTKNIDVVDMARQQHVHIICLPPHSTHRMQPTDVGFMAPLARYYDMALEKFLNNHPGRVVTVFQIAKIFGDAYLQAATPLTSINAFKKCGLVPYDPNIFTDLDFAPSDVTEKNLASNDLPQSDEVLPSESTTNYLSESEDKESIPSTSTAGMTLSKPTHSKLEEELPSAYLRSIENKKKSSFGSESPVDIRPLPKRIKTDQPLRKHKKGKAAILTSSPYKLELQAELKIKEEKEAKKKEMVKRKIASQEDEPKEKKARIKNIPSKKGKAKKKMKIIDEEDENEGSKDAECFYCTELFSASVSEEGWVRCCKCLQWAHEACAGIEPEDDEAFICEYCAEC